MKIDYDCKDNKLCCVFTFHQKAKRDTNKQLITYHTSPLNCALSFVPLLDINTFTLNPNSAKRVRECKVYPHMYQLKEYIKSFQREMSFPKPQRGEIFIETTIPKNQAPEERHIENQLED